MAFIAESDRVKLQELFADELAGDVAVHLTSHPPGCAMCASAEGVLEELVSLSGRLEIVRERGGGPLPEIRLAGAARGEVRFVGLPSGYEFPGLIETIIDVSRGDTALAGETVLALSELKRDVHLQVFTTPT